MVSIPKCSSIAESSTFQPLESQALPAGRSARPGFRRVSGLQRPLLAVVVEPGPQPYVGAVGGVAVGHVGHLAAVGVQQAEPAVVRVDQLPALATVVPPGVLLDVGAVGGAAVVDV